MADLVSTCCQAPVRVAWEDADVNWRTQWYECSKCGKACDPVKKVGPWIVDKIVRGK